MNLPSHEERIASIEIELTLLHRLRRKGTADIYSVRIDILNYDLCRLRDELAVQRAKVDSVRRDRHARDRRR
jgi:hypothetical protein